MPEDLSIRKSEPLALVVCSNLSPDENKIALFWVEVDNKSAAPIDVNPDAMQLNVTSQKRFVRLQGSAYTAAVNESANERSDSWNHTKIPDMVRDERKKIETKREQFLAVVPLLITRNTLDPGQRLEGYVAFKRDTYALSDVYQKKGESMTLTMPIGQKSENFQFMFE